MFECMRYLRSENTRSSGFGADERLLRDSGTCQAFVILMYFEAH